jgi:uncharacterized membrane protein YphA (DoxX/SURF4 family)
MDLALLVIRLAVGLLFVSHGAQKLFGVFGGGGLRPPPGCSTASASGLAGSTPEPPARAGSSAARCSPSACSRPLPPRR